MHPLSKAESRCTEYGDADKSERIATPGQPVRFDVFHTPHFLYVPMPLLA